MSRSCIRTLISVSLAVYGLYVASYLPGMLLPGQSTPGLVALFALQASCSLVGAVGVWRRRPWAADVVIALGVMVATTSVLEGFLLGIIPYLQVLAVVVGALAVTFVVAGYLNGAPNPWMTSSSHRR